MIRRYHIALVLMMLACAWQTHAAEVEPVCVYDHTSALTRGAPFNKRDERTQDYFGCGITLTLGARKRFEIDITHGRKQIDGLSDEQGSNITVRFYPRRGR